jgi:hypothetical protein
VSGALKNIPVYAVMAEDVGERGALFTALRLLQDVKAEEVVGAVGSGAKGCGLSCSLSCADAHCYFWGAALLAAGVAIGFYAHRLKRT